MERGFFGVVIPIAILDSTDLTMAEKFIYSYVASYSKACFDSNEKIAERLNVSVPTVTRALKKLQSMQYLFVEHINNDNSKRRIYAIFENPKKIAYLAKKGYFNREEEQSFPQSNQNDESPLESNQNDENSNQNDESHNGGESNQNDYQRIKNKKKKEETEQKPNTTAEASELENGSSVQPEFKRKPFRSEFASDDEYEKALYNFFEGA